MPVLVNDPDVSARLTAERAKTDGAQHDEVWDGVYIMSPLPNVEHQVISARLWKVIDAIVEESGSGLAINAVNVSDREAGWTHNFREPDVAVVLEGNPAKNCDTHWCGGPDFLVEVLSPNDLAREKRSFYAEVGVRELLIVDRYPWVLELYRLDQGELALVGKSSLDEPQHLVSAVLPLSFRLVAGPERPKIEVRRRDESQVWTI